MTIAALPRHSTQTKAASRATSGLHADRVSLSVWTLFLVTFLIFEFCMTIYTYSVLGNAAREGVRYAIVHGSDSSSCSGPSSGCGDTAGSNVTAVVNSYAAISFHDISAMTVTPSWPDGTSTPSSRVLVTISYPYIALPDVAGIRSPANAGYRRRTDCLLRGVMLMNSRQDRAKPQQRRQEQGRPASWWSDVEFIPAGGAGLCGGLYQHLVSAPAGANGGRRRLSAPGQWISISWPRRELCRTCGFVLGTAGSCSAYGSAGPTMCWYASKNGFNGYTGGAATRFLDAFPARWPA